MSVVAQYYSLCDKSASFSEFIIVEESSYRC